MATGLMAESAEIIVIGGGVIGVSVGLTLQARGRQVTIIDRKGVAAETSAGNAGCFAFSAVVPLATPGVMRKAPGWLIDPKGPLSVPPSYAFQIAPWLYRFWRASRPSRYRAALNAQAVLMRASEQALDALIAAHDLGDEMRTDRNLELYDTVASFERSRRHWADVSGEGVRIELIESRDRLLEVQPGLAPHFERGVWTPSWRNVRDPKIWVETLAARFRALGGKIEIGNVTALEPGPRAVVNGAPRVAAQIIVAAGAWSHHLARSLGDRIPLETERGYNTTLPAGAFELQTQLTFADHGFVIGRIGDGVRVGGAVELGGLRAAPNFQRSKAMLSKAKRFLPELKTSGGVEWMGHRPSLPDSLPVIGVAPGAPGVIYAFGHGHLGLTQSAGTARVVADLVIETGPQLDLAPYRADRF